MKSFEDFKKESLLTGFFETAINNGSLGQSYILEGVRGTDKAGLALAVAAILLCTDRKGCSPCGRCHACRMMESGNHPDCITLVHEKPKVVSVKEIREQIVGNTDIRPYYGGRKIYIIPDAQYMNVQAQNAILKTIEEPPSYAVYFILTTDQELLLPTIRSRCVTLSFREEPVYEPEDEETEAVYRQLDGILMREESEDTGRISEFAKELGKETPERLMDILAYIEMSCHDALFMKSGADLTGKAATGYIGKMSEMTYEGLEKILQSVIRARQDIRTNVTAETVLFSLLLQIKDTV